MELDASAKVVRKKQAKPGRSVGGFSLTFFIMFGGWVLLSGKFDLFHLSLGVISCLIVAFISSDLLFADFDPKEISIRWPRFVAYIPWLLYQVALANIHVLILVLHPRMMDLIDPKIIRFKCKLKSDMSLTIFANSITLTPGTITVFATDFGEFEVHCLDSHSGDALPGEMEQKIAKVFGE